MSYTQENSEVLKTILNACFFNPWKDENYKTTIQNRQLGLEIYITAECNQHCEYCYLVKHGDKLYPKDIRNKDNILKNLTILCDWILKEAPQLKRIDIFSGEIFHTDFGLKILDILYEYKKKGAGYNTIVIPSNYSFLLYPEHTEKLKEYIKLYNEMGVGLIFSASVDGPFIDNDTRSFNNTALNNLRNQDFYDKVFEFAKVSGGGFHPMVSAYSIERWQENLLWFFDQCEKYDYHFIDTVMTLEVRNNDWTEEKIQKFEEYLWFYYKTLLEKAYNGDKKDMSYAIFGLKLSTHPMTGYCALKIFDDIQIPSCGIGQQLCVRLGDLAIAPCHRTSYKELLYGKFVVENDKIVDIESNSVANAVKVLMVNQRMAHHGCDTCWNKNSCIKQCLGCQYEEGEEMFIPISNICKFLKRKTKTILKIYDDLQLVKYLQEFVKNNPANEEAISSYITQIAELAKVIEMEEI